MGGDVMVFPDTWEEYEEDYGFTDTEQIYTNGSRLIQSFRVKQWLDHIEVEDCISREYMLKLQRELHGWMPNDKNHELWQKIKDAPSVVPSREEPKCGKWILDEEESKKHIEPIYICSACKNYEAWGNTEKTPFCPNCGARMESDEE